MSASTPAVVAMAATKPSFLQAPDLTSFSTEGCGSENVAVKEEPTGILGSDARKTA